MTSRVCPRLPRSEINGKVSRGQDVSSPVREGCPGVPYENFCVGIRVNFIFAITECRDG